MECSPLLDYPITTRILMPTIGHLSAIVGKSLTKFLTVCFLVIRSPVDAIKAKAHSRMAATAILFIQLGGE